MATLIQRINANLVNQTIAAGVMFLPIALVSGDASWLWGLVVLTGYSVFAPLRALWQREFWPNLGGAVLGWICLFQLIAQTCSYVSHSGEGAMVLLLPIMVFPCVLLLAILIQLVRRAPPPNPNDPDLPPPP